MASIILHHYPQSPVSEKVRVALGIKNVAWHSVHIPRIPPKPELMTLTGGYRRTPVMQIGADIYCDSLCILKTLHRVVPTPPFFPDGDESWALSAWTDGQLFRQAVAVVLGSEVDNLPADFAADRGRLYFGPDYDLHAIAAELEFLVGQLRAQLNLMQKLLGSRSFMHGNQPGLVDALCYYLVWFIRGRYGGGPDLLAEFPSLGTWEQRVAALGHGDQKDMSPQQAQDIALQNTSTVNLEIDAADPLHLKLSDQVWVTPDGDGGDPSVSGELVCFNSECIAVRRRHQRVGEVVVHFPRIGYRVTREDNH